MFLPAFGCLSSLFYTQRKWLPAAELLASATDLGLNTFRKFRTSVRLVKQIYVLKPFLKKQEEFKRHILAKRLHRWGKEEPRVMLWAAAGARGSAFCCQPGTTTCSRSPSAPGEH